MTLLMVYVSAVIMAVDIWKFLQFARRIRARGDWTQEERILRVPIILLILFLLGYLAVGLFGEPDLIVALILFGGSIFVFLTELLMDHITDRIRENERLEARARAAEDASIAKTRFLSDMSHDMRTPLNAILGYTTLARDASPDEQKEFVAKIETAGKQMLNLVNEILEMSRIESGRQELEESDTDLEALVRQAGDLFNDQMEEKGLHYTITTDLPDHWVHCDANRLRRILTNFLSNACKFTEPGGRVELKAVEVRQGAGGHGVGGSSGSVGSSGGASVGSSGDASVGSSDGASDKDLLHYEFRIMDTGIGMSPEFAERVFSPFERERNDIVSQIQGTGLGMAISKSFIDLMGGTVDVHTEQGLGTEFVIRLSFRPGSPTNTAELTFGKMPEPRPCGCTGAAAGAAATGAPAPTRLLLADDNAINREIATMLLTQAGYTVDCAENGALAIELLTSSCPCTYSAILMDIQMPVMDGYQATRRIRALEDPHLSRIPIIAMTANAFREDVQAAREAGMQAHIAKPIDVDKMLATIREVLE